MAADYLIAFGIPVVFAVVVWLMIGWIDRLLDFWRAS